MMRSLFAGVSGLRNHQVRMDVIGNNVANVNTVAFKSGRVTFKEGFAQLLQGASRPPGDHGGINPIQVGLGMQVGSIDQMFTQGNIETTGVNTDMAIQGDSFFVVAKGNQHFYTRSGNFQLDADGRLVSPTNGFVVQGRMAVNGVLRDGITDIRLPFGQKTPARATTSVALAGNLNAAAPLFTGPFVPADLAVPVTDAVNFLAAHTQIASVNVVDPTPSAYFNVVQENGNTLRLYRNEQPTTITANIAGLQAGDPIALGPLSIQIGAGWDGSAPLFPSNWDQASAITHQSTETLNDPANRTAYTGTSITVYDSLGSKHELKVQMWKTGSNEWSWQVDPSNLQLEDGTTLTGSGRFTFTENGELASPTPAIIRFTPEGADEVSIVLDPGSGMNGLSHFAASSTAVLRDQDGYTMGTLQNFSIDRTGTVAGAFTNGINVTLGQIVLADFNNPSGMLRVGDNMYAVSGNSGGAVLGFALEGSQSFITSGALEMSNVDLAQEFTNMIVSQRGFQANSRVITNSDEMLQEVVNLKR